MDGTLFDRLESYTKLSNADRHALNHLGRRSITIGSRTDLISEGDRPSCVNLVLRGWACRYKMLPDGKRSMVSFFIPGDFCDLNIYILREMDHSIGAITPLRVAQIDPDELMRVMESHPRITQALLWHELVSAAVQREWTHNLASRPAYERLAHLFVEMFLRLRSVGLARDNTVDFPLTQSDLGEATGLTPVHVNRTLQSLRADGLVQLEGKQLTLIDLTALMNAAMFNPNYLHLDREGAYLDAND